MVKYITLGKFNKYYFFLLGSVAVRIIKVFIIGFKTSLNNQIYLFKHKPFFIRHPFFMEFLQYFFFALIGFILEMIYYRNNNNKLSNDKADEATENNNDSINYDNINNDIASDKIGEINDKKNFWKILLVIFFCFLSLIVSDLLENLGVTSLKLWPLEYIFLIIFSKKILNRILYKHQNVSLLIIIVFCSIIVVVNSFTPISTQENRLKGEKSNIYKAISNFGCHFIPIIIIIYLIIMILNAFSIVSFKWLMDIQYITITRIIMYIGMMGFIISFALFFIVSNKSCGKSDDEESIRVNLSKICPFNESTNLYYENYRNLTRVQKDSNFYIDIFLALILFLVVSFLNIFFNFMIIKNLDPFYLMQSNSIFHAIIEIIDYSITLGTINKNDNNEEYNNYKKIFPGRHIKFALSSVNNGVSIIFSLIYFEIIELHFCGLDQYLRRNILKREALDKQILLLTIEEEEEDENEKENNDNQ